ncbi:hypothetical protein [Halosimplex pelagicum]|uniref:Uncharacterized protein n=1 Tax=Halosimplex pelagicum TaxID=869886 RepID=A0A7D5TGB3_9EURY|nr:hypothetical protein [Halosimplex pelagicum]QLH81376.1 hypothetical protein HZS54_06935 [Halosimplex pelagicum]
MAGSWRDSSNRSEIEKLTLALWALIGGLAIGFAISTIGMAAAWWFSWDISVAISGLLGATITTTGFTLYVAFNPDGLSKRVQNAID